MIPKLRDALLCLLLLALLIGTVAAEWWITHRSSQLDSIIRNVGNSTYNLSNVTWQADEALLDARPILHKSLIHADQAAGETSRTMQHIAHVTQDLADEQKQTSKATMVILGKTYETIDTLNDQIDKSGEQLRFTLSAGETLLQSGKSTIDDLDRNFINNQHLQEVAENMAGTTASWNDLSSDAVKVERRYFFPAAYTGKHPFLHRFGRSVYGTVKTVGPFSEFWYYMSNSK